MTQKSLTVSSTGTWKNRAKTLLTRCVFWPTISIVSGVWFLAVCVGLGLYLALDFIPKRKSKPLTSPTPPTPKLPHLYRPRGSSDIFAEFSDGTVIQLEPMQAKLYAEACFEAVAGAFVYEKTKLPDRQ